MDQSYNCQSN